MKIWKNVIAVLVVALTLVLVCAPAASLLAQAATTQTQLWDLDDLAADTAVGTNSSNKPDRDDVSGSVVSGRGVGGSNALAYNVDANNANTAAQTDTLTIDDFTNLGFATSATVAATTDILWFWVNSDLNFDARLQLEVNGGATYANSGYIYTIDRNNSGNAEMVKINVGSSHGDLSLNVHSGAGVSRIRMRNGWSGWVGIPVQFIGENGLAAGATITKLAIIFGYRDADTNYNNRQPGSVYFDEFWITSAGTMPNLTNEELLEDGDRIHLWNVGGSFNLVEKLHNERNDSLTTYSAGTGVNGSAAVKYEATEAGTVTSSHPGEPYGDVDRSMTHTNDNFAWSSRTGGRAGTVKATSDIFWMWIDAELSTIQRFTFQLQGSEISANSTIYTIVNSNGTPAIQEIPFSPDSRNPIDTVEGIDLVYANGFGNTDEHAHIRLTDPDWCGWIGIPIEALKNGLTAGATLEKFNLLLNQYSSEDAIANQQVGDAVHMDEFWLTPAGEMPNLSNDELLYNGDCTLIWDVENTTINVTVSDHDNRNDTLATNVSGTGVGSSSAMKYELTQEDVVTETHSTGISRSMSETVSITWANYAGKAATIQNEDDIFWFWMDAELSTVQHVTFLLMNKHLAKDAVIYTIVSDNGVARIQEITYTPDSASAPTDEVDGIDLVNRNSYGTNEIEADIKLTNPDWCGWIGIPMNALNDTEGNTFVPGAQLTNFRLQFNQFDSEDVIANQQVGDAVYLDEFWLTPAGTMPGLSNEKLLYNGDVAPLWDFESVALSGSLVSNRVDRNQATVKRVNQYGYNGSYAMEYRQTSLASLEGNLKFYNAGQGDTTFSYANQPHMTGTAQFTNATTLSNNGFNTNVAIGSDDDILWFWAHNDMSVDMRLEIALNDLHPKGTADVTDASTVYIYTIDETGSRVKIGLQAYNGQIDGVGLVNNGTAGDYAQLKLKEDWSGWIGIPMNILHDNKGVLQPFAAGDRITKITLLMRMTNGTDGYINNQVGDEAIYLDEFWLTSANEYPGVDALTVAPSVKLKLAERYQSDMIFQRDKAWKLHGIAPAGKTVTVTLKNSSGTAVQTKTATADSNNNWSVTMDAMSGSYDAYSIVVSCNGSLTKTLTNIVFGEVWVAGGQSNMQYKIFQTYNDMFNSIADVQALQQYLTDNPTKAAAIRVFSTYTALADITQGAYTDTTGSWHTAEDWGVVQLTTALGMHYAKMLQEHLDMPVGIVSTNRGGTSIATWVSPEVSEQEKNATFYGYLEEYERFTTDNTQNHAYGFYNTTVAPWAGYEVAGMLWYQGENDRSYPNLQRYGYDVMVETFSRTFTMNPESGNRLNVISVQIAPYVDPTSGTIPEDLAADKTKNLGGYIIGYKDLTLKKNTALNEAMREGVATAQQSGNVVLVPIYDLPSVVADHHPLNKLDVANRLIQVAKETYYSADAAEKSYSGPEIIAYKWKDSQTLVLTFDQEIQYIQLTTADNERSFPPYDNFPCAAGAELALNDMLGDLYDSTGFALYQDKLDGFSMWNGESYVTLTATVSGPNQVTLTVPTGTPANMLTYAYGAHTLTANLYDKDGLPALPFAIDVRYDSWHSTYQKQIWSGQEMDAYVINGNNAYTGEVARNTSKISIDSNEGFNGSQGLKYELVTKGNQRTNTWVTGNTKDVLGFDTDFTVVNDDDVIWFWAKSSLSTVQRLQISFNHNLVADSADSYIYTIQSGGDGEPVRVKLPYGGEDTVDGVSLMAYNGAAAQIQLEPGWYGWIGLPMNCMYADTGYEKIASGDALNYLSVLLYQYDTEDPVANQKVGDALILDEVWLTDSNSMPALTDMVDFRVMIWNAEDSDLADGTELEDVPYTNSAERAKLGASITGDIGVGESNALTVTYKDTDFTNTYDIVLSVDEDDLEKPANMLELSFTKAHIQNNEVGNSDILWFWIDSDLPVNRLLHVQLNDSRNLYDEKIYTIVDVDGVPTIQTINYDPNGWIEGDTLGLVKYNSISADTAGEIDITKDPLKYARVRIPANWCGWVGVPMSNMLNLDAEPTYGYIETVQFRLYGPKNEILVGEQVFFDEIWLTEPGMMPALSSYKLTYNTEHQTQLWSLDESNAALTSEFVLNNTLRNQASVTRVTNGGVFDSNALNYKITELVDTTGEYRRDLVETLKLENTELLNANGFKTGVDAKAKTDILWFWIDSDMSLNMRIQPGINNMYIRGGFEESTPTDMSVNKNIYIYTIVEDENGDPMMKRIYHTACGSTVDGIGLVNSSRSNKGQVSQLKFTNGWSGWVGIPLNMLVAAVDENTTNGQTVQVGDVIREVTLQMRIFNGVDGNMYKMSTADEECMLIDEFWLTTIWMMPEPVIESYTIEEAQLYTDDEPHTENGHLLAPETADSYIDLINSDAGSLMAKDYFETNQSGNVTTDQWDFGIINSKGYLRGKAFYLTFLEGNEGLYTSWATLNLTEPSAIRDLNITGGTNVSVDDVLWFWVDGTDLTVDGCLTVRVNGDHAKYDNVYYTVVPATNGYYLEEKILDKYDPAAGSADGTAGTIPIAKGFQGWIGMPIANYIEKVDGDAVVPSINLEKLNFHLRKKYGGTNHSVGSTIYFGDIHIGSPYSETTSEGTLSTWEIPPQAELKFSSASLVIQNGLSVKFKAKPGLFVDPTLENTIFYNTPYAVFRLNGVNNVVYGELNESTGMYEFTYYNIRPDWMDDDIEAWLFAYRDGVLYRSKVEVLYSVGDYCYNTLNRYYGDDAPQKDEMGTLLVDVLNYGAAAQEYTGHNTDALVTAKLAGTAWENWGSTTTYTYANIPTHTAQDQAVENATVTWKGGALYLRETTRIRLRITTTLTEGMRMKYANADGSISGYVDMDEFVRAQYGFYVFFDDYNVMQMEEPIYFTIVEDDGDEDMTNDVALSSRLRYSVISYVNTVAKTDTNLTSTTLGRMLAAMLRYGDAAKAYVASITG